MRWSCDLGPNRSEPVAVPMVLDTRPNGKCIENPCFQWKIDVNSMVSVDVPLLFTYPLISLISIHALICNQWDGVLFAPAGYNLSCDLFREIARDIFRISDNQQTTYAGYCRIPCKSCHGNTFPFAVQPA